MIGLHRDSNPMKAMSQIDSFVELMVQLSSFGISSKYSIANNDIERDYIEIISRREFGPRFKLRNLGNSDDNALGYLLKKIYDISRINGIYMYLLLEPNSPEIHEALNRKHLAFKTSKYPTLSTLLNASYRENNEAATLYKNYLYISRVLPFIMFHTYCISDGKYHAKLKLAMERINDCLYVLNTGDLAYRREYKTATDALKEKIKYQTKTLFNLISNYNIFNKKLFTLANNIVSDNIPNIAEKERNAKTYLNELNRRTEAPILDEETRSTEFPEEGVDNETIGPTL